VLVRRGRLSVTENCLKPHPLAAFSLLRVGCADGVTKTWVLAVQSGSGGGTRHFTLSERHHSSNNINVNATSPHHCHHHQQPAQRYHYYRQQQQQQQQDQGQDQGQGGDDAAEMRRKLMQWCRWRRRYGVLSTVCIADEITRPASGQ